MQRTHVLVVKDETLLTRLENVTEKVVLLRDDLSVDRNFEPGDIIYISDPTGLVFLRLEVGFIARSSSLPVGDVTLLDLYPEVSYASGYIVGVTCVQITFPMEVLEKPLRDVWTTFHDDPVAGDLVDVVRVVDTKSIIVDRISRHKAERLIAEGILEYDTLHRMIRLRGNTKHYVKRRDLCRCRYCGQQKAEHLLTVDHVIPRFRCTDDHPSNLVAACRACNLEKAHMTPTEYLRYRREKGLSEVKPESLVFTDRAIRDIDTLGIVPETEPVENKVSFIRQLMKSITNVEERRSTLHLYCDFLKLTVVGRRYIVRVLPVAS